MGNFDPRLDKWGEHEISSWGMQLKDNIFNKGKVERMRKRAAKRATRRARWKASLFGRFIGWLIKWFWRVVMFAVLILVVRFFYGVFQIGDMIW